MVVKICAFLAVALFASVYAQEECEAGAVQDLKITAHHLLTWEVSEDEICVINQFLVYIFQRDQPIEYSFEVDEQYVDISFLEVCAEWTFVVVPISGHTRGREHQLFANIPLPANADISIAYINITRNGLTDDLHLSWDLTEPRFSYCSLRYRVTIEAEGSDITHDLYQSERSVNIHFLSACTTYQIGVRAINIAHPTIEGPLRSRMYDYPAAPQLAPKISDLDQSATAIDMIWEIEDRVRNNCEVLEFLVTGGQYFNVSVLYDDKPQRDHIPLSVSSLRPNSMYYMQAAVRNDAGWSQPTVVAIQTLDVSPDKSENTSS